jgi:hypothetical protein
VALGFYFTHGGFTPDKYNEVIKELDAAGAGAPNGRSIHVALESNGEIQVFDVWNSQEEFDGLGTAFKRTYGVSPGQHRSRPRAEQLA